MREPRRSILAISIILCVLSGCAPVKKGVRTTKPAVQTSGSPPPGTVLGTRTVKAIEPIHVQTGRYSYVSAKPLAEQVNPLLVVIDVRIPHDFTTVEEVANYLLARSGYRLAAPSA